MFCSRPSAASCKAIINYEDGYEEFEVTDETLQRRALEWCSKSLLEEME